MCESPPSTITRNPSVIRKNNQSSRDFDALEKHSQEIEPLPKKRRLLELVDCNDNHHAINSPPSLTPFQNVSESSVVSTTDNTSSTVIETSKGDDHVQSTLPSSHNADNSVSVEKVEEVKADHPTSLKAPSTKEHSQDSAESDPGVKKISQQIRESPTQDTNLISNPGGENESSPITKANLERSSPKLVSSPKINNSTESSATRVDYNVSKQDTDMSFPKEITQKRKLEYEKGGGEFQDILAKACHAVGLDEGLMDISDSFEEKGSSNQKTSLGYPDPVRVPREYFSREYYTAFQKDLNNRRLYFNHGDTRKFTKENNGISCKPATTPCGPAIRENHPYSSPHYNQYPYSYRTPTMTQVRPQVQSHVVSYPSESYPKNHSHYSTADYYYRYPQNPAASHPRGYPGYGYQGNESYSNWHRGNYPYPGTDPSRIYINHRFSPPFNNSAPLRQASPVTQATSNMSPCRFETPTNGAIQSHYPYDPVQGPTKPGQVPVTIPSKIQYYHHDVQSSKPAVCNIRPPNVISPQGYSTQVIKYSPVRSPISSGTFNNVVPVTSTTSNHEGKANQYKEGFLPSYPNYDVTSMPPLYSEVNGSKKLLSNQRNPNPNTSSVISQNKLVNGYSKETEPRNSYQQGPYVIEKVRQYTPPSYYSEWNIPTNNLISESRTNSLKHDNKQAENQNKSQTNQTEHIFHGLYSEYHKSSSHSNTKNVANKTVQPKFNKTLSGHYNYDSSLSCHEKYQHYNQSEDYAHVNSSSNYLPYAEPATYARPPIHHKSNNSTSVSYTTVTPLTNSIQSLSNSTSALPSATNSSTNQNPSFHRSQLQNEVRSSQSFPSQPRNDRAINKSQQRIKDYDREAKTSRTNRKLLRDNPISENFRNQHNSNNAVSGSCNQLTCVNVDKGSYSLSFSANHESHSPAKICTNFPPIENKMDCTRQHPRKETFTSCEASDREALLKEFEEKTLQRTASESIQQSEQENELKKKHNSLPNELTIGHFILNKGYATFSNPKDSENELLLFKQKLLPVIDQLLSIPEAASLRPLRDSPDELLDHLVRLWGGKGSSSCAKDCYQRMKENFVSVVKYLFKPHLLMSWGWDKAPPEQILDELLNSAEQGDILSRANLEAIPCPVGSLSLDDEVFLPSSNISCNELSEDLLTYFNIMEPESTNDYPSLGSLESGNSTASHSNGPSINDSLAESHKYLENNFVVENNDKTKSYRNSCSLSKPLECRFLDIANIDSMNKTGIEPKLDSVEDMIPSILPESEVSEAKAPCSNVSESLPLVPSSKYNYIYPHDNLSPPCSDFQRSRNETHSLPPKHLNIISQEEIENEFENHRNDRSTLELSSSDNKLKSDSELDIAKRNDWQQLTEHLMEFKQSKHKITNPCSSTSEPFKEHSFEDKQAFLVHPNKNPNKNECLEKIEHNAILETLRVGKASISSPKIPENVNDCESMKASCHYETPVFTNFHPTVLSSTTFDDENQKVKETNTALEGESEEKQMEGEKEQNPPKYPLEKDERKDFHINPYEINCSNQETQSKNFKKIRKKNVITNKSGKDFAGKPKLNLSRTLITNEALKPERRPSDSCSPVSNIDEKQINEINQNQNTETSIEQESNQSSQASPKDPDSSKTNECKKQNELSELSRNKSYASPQDERTPNGSTKCTSTDLLEKGTSKLITFDRKSSHEHMLQGKIQDKDQQKTIIAKESATTSQADKKHSNLDEPLQSKLKTAVHERRPPTHSNRSKEMKKDYFLERLRTQLSTTLRKDTVRGLSQGTDFTNIFKKHIESKMLLSNPNEKDT